MENPLSPDGDSWRPGDVVNVSRPSQDGGGLTLGHVVRIYPTSAMIEWPADALHPQPWTTEEKKTSLIFVSHDAAWTRRSVPDSRCAATDDSCEQPRTVERNAGVPVRHAVICATAKLLSVAIDSKGRHG